jgi:hypothetical protein
MYTEDLHQDGMCIAYLPIVCTCSVMLCFLGTKLRKEDWFGVEHVTEYLSYALTLHYDLLKKKTFTSRESL